MYVSSCFLLRLPMSSVLTLLFAPSFLLLVRYFDFQQIVLSYILFLLVILVYAYLYKKKFEDFFILGIYLILLIISYFYASLTAVKFIPVFTSMAFCAIFAEAAIKKREFVYKLTQKFYKKNLLEKEREYLKKGDAYWAVCIFLYTVIQVIIIFTADDDFWAFYSSVGWYIYFVLILSLQILYGKLYVLKVSS